MIFSAEIVEAFHLPQHAGVGACHAGHGEHADESSGEKDVEVMNGDGNLAELPLCIASDKEDVPTFPQNLLPKIRMVARPTFAKRGRIWATGQSRKARLTKPQWSVCTPPPLPTILFGRPEKPNNPGGDSVNEKHTGCLPKDELDVDLPR